MCTFEKEKSFLATNRRRWLITGVAGFIGSNLLEFLLAHNQQVVGLDNFATGYSDNLEQVRASVGEQRWRAFRFIEGDICDLPICERAVDGADFVLHQAALGSVPRSIEDPVETNRINIGGFLNMLVAARNGQVRSFVYAASSSTYGDSQELPKFEQRIGNPLSPYAVTKLVNELYAEVFERTYGFSSIGLRYFNIFGPRQDPNGAYAAVIPRWIAAMLAGKRIQIFGQGDTSRDFCFVENAIEANVLAALTRNDAARGQVFNVALNDQTTLNELFDIMRGMIAERMPELDIADPEHLDYRKGDVKHSRASIDKAKEMLGYDPQFRIRQGMELSMDWYIDHLRA